MADDAADALEFTPHSRSHHASCHADFTAGFPTDNTTCVFALVIDDTAIYFASGNHDSCI